MQLSIFEAGAAHPVVILADAVATTDDGATAEPSLELAAFASQATTETAAAVEAASSAAAAVEAASSAAAVTTAEEASPAAETTAGSSSPGKRNAEAASAPLAKPATAAPPPHFRALRVEAINARLMRASKSGSVSALLINGDTQQPLSLVLAMPGEDAGCDVPFGLEVTHPLKEPPSFLGGPARGGGVEGLDMLVSLDAAQVATLERMEARVRALALEQSKEWFGRAVRPDALDRMFSSLLKRPAADKNYAVNLKAKMELSAPPELRQYLTAITVVRRNGEGEEGRGVVTRGEGWDFVQPQLADARNWRRCEVWPTVEFRTVWITKTNFGIRASFKEIVIREPQRQTYGQAYSEEACRELLGLTSASPSSSSRSSPA